MGNQLKRTKFFPLWQEEKEMDWLSTMSRQGWHLKSKGYMTYWFEKGENTEYIYNIDYKLTADKDIDEYMSIYDDAGWEFVDSYTNWHYFRTIKGSKTIYCDVESKKRRLKKILMLLLSLAGANVSIIFINLLISWVGFEKLSAIPPMLYIIWGISAVVVLLLIMTSIKLFYELRKLGKSIIE
jgi:hypothetical protein